LLTDGGPNSATGDAVLDPELADAGIRVREREAAVGERVRKARGVEIYSKAAGLGPVDPTLEVLLAGGIPAKPASTPISSVNGPEP